jgi:hypothetical protein
LRRSAIAALVAGRISAKRSSAAHRFGRSEDNQPIAVANPALDLFIELRDVGDVQPGLPPLRCRQIASK